MQGSSDKRFVKNAVIISLGGFIAKILGAVYRIPLTNIIGGTGMGLYQMVFPVYCILLDFAGAGLPCGLSKLVAECPAETRDEEGRKLLKTALFLMAAIGAAGSLFMFALSGALASSQGNAAARLSYIALSPAVFLVALISCYRGYFQGRQNMLPTAVSQIIEQAVKLAVGLSLVSLLAPSAPKAAAGAAFAVSVSEAAALVYLYVKFGKQGKISYADEKGGFGSRAKAIFKICLPVTLTAVMIPASQAADSFLIINILSRTSENATSLYGLFSGGVAAVIGVPVALCYGIAVSVLPAVSEGGDADGKISLAVLLTAVLAGVMAAACFFFPNLIVRILFFGLSAEEKSVAAGLLKISSFSVLLLSLTQTTNSVLVGKSKPYLPVLSLSLGIITKIVLELLLLPRERFGIYGAAFSANACYFVAVFFNLLYIIYTASSKRRAERSRNEEKPAG